jgi:hypothetical protein
MKPSEEPCYVWNDHPHFGGKCLLVGPRQVVRGYVSVRPGQVIFRRTQKHRDRARELRASVKSYAGEKRKTIVAEAEHEERCAAGGRNLYRCEVCGVWAMWGLGWAAWGSIDDVKATVCSEACKKRYKTPRRRAEGNRA